MDANRIAAGYELKDELARTSLPSTGSDTHLKLAWTNSVCILFLLIGIAGARRGLIAIKPVPPLAEPVSVVIQPLTLPPQQAAPKNESSESESFHPEPVAVVIPQMPAINFSVPTIGSLVVPANLAAAPPLEPMQKKAEVGTVASTGSSGERPEPPYPKLAQNTGEQGTVVIVLQGDAAGNIVSAEVKSSSGYPILDRGTLDFIKRHWRLPTGTGAHFFQTSITYKLQF